MKAKKLKLKKRRSLKVKPQEIEKEPELLFAKNAQAGMQYVNWNLNSVLELDGIREGKIIFNVKDMNGNLLRIDVQPHYPILSDEKLLKKIMEKHTIMRQIELSKITGKTVKITVDRETGEVKKKRMGGFGRRERDEKTGCVPGTTAHIMGEIMLRVGLTPDKKKKCVEEMFKVLKEQFDDKKAKNLAASWYHTHRRNKPEIYIPKTEAK